MLTSSVLYKEALHGPHKRAAYIDSYDIDGNLLAQRIPIIEGSVRANLTNRVTRTATFSVPEEWWPRSPDDPLSSFQAVVRIFAGTQYGDGSSDVFPIFTGRIYDPVRETDGSASFRADDLAADVIAFRFERPQQSTRLPFENIVTESQRLILEAVPQATFGTSNVPLAPVPRLVWDEDRGQALDDLAEAGGGRWFALGNGDFVLRRFDYEPVTPVQEFLDGPGGLMSRASISQTRDGAANSVTVVSERLDGTDPVRRTVRNNAGPTAFNGKFGKVSQVIKVQTPLTEAEAENLARTQLGAATALTEQWTSEVVPDYTMEPGDTGRLRYRGVMADQIIDGIDYPLMTDRPMALFSRGSVPTDIVGE